MKVAVFSIRSYERDVLERENSQHRHDLAFFKFELSQKSAELTKGFDAVAAFVSDCLDRAVLETLKHNGVKLVALRSAGYNHVDLKAAASLGLPVVRVPDYSPFAVAEHAVALIMALNRKTHRAYNRVRELNFDLEGLVGFDLHGKTVGIIGTGKIGSAFANIMNGFGCHVLAYDQTESAQLEAEAGVRYVDLPTLYRESDIVSLHLPLTRDTRHIIDARAIEQMKKGVLLINTGRGALIETKALIDALKKHRLGGAGLDVYEEEEHVFFHDLSQEGITDDLLARLLTFPNVIITAHQGFLTCEAITNIARRTIRNLDEFEAGRKLSCQILEPENSAPKAKLPEMERGLQ